MAFDVDLLEKHRNEAGVGEMRVVPAARVRTFPISSALLIKSNPAQLAHPAHITHRRNARILSRVGAMASPWRSTNSSNIGISPVAF